MRSIALQLVTESNIIPIKPIDNAAAQALLQKKLGEIVNKNNTAKLVGVLKFMPLTFM